MAVKALLDFEIGVPLDEADRLFARRLRLELKADQAVRMPITTHKQMFAYLTCLTKMETVRKQILLAGQRLTEQSRAAADRQQITSLQRELEELRCASQAPQKVGSVTDTLAATAAALAGLRWDDELAPNSAVAADILPFVCASETPSEQTRKADGPISEPQLPSNRFSHSA